MKVSNLIIISSIALYSCILHARPSIIGGEPVENNSYPSVVSLTMETTYKGEKIQTYFCTGSLLSKTEVITAAHCLDYFNFEEMFQTRDEFKSALKIYVGDGSYKEYVGTYSVKEYYAHPDFMQTTMYKNDYGYIVLNEEVDIKEDDIIKLPSSLKEYEEILKLNKEKTALVVGYGSDFEGINSGLKKEVIIDIVSFENIQDIEFIIAGDYKKSAYHGDSGGPLFLKDEDNKWKQMATVRGPIGEHGMYLAINKYIFWVYELKAQLAFDNNQYKEAAKYIKHAKEFKTYEDLSKLNDLTKKIDAL